MKNYLKSKLPIETYKKIRYPLILKRAVTNFFYDAKSFLSNATLDSSPHDSVSYVALITMEYHKLEKALALPSPREVYGLVISKNILNIINDNTELAVQCVEVTATAVKVLEDYQTRISMVDDERCVVLSQEIEAALVGIKANIPMLASFIEHSKGGVIVNAEVGNHSYDFFSEFMRNRKTIRNFTDTPIDRGVIEKAVSIAKYTPSVCNRQPWKTIYIDDKSKMKSALAFQNGNGGFGDNAAGLFIITSSYKHFPLSGERNQIWVDGGMFSMSLLLALHSCGIAACALNWGNDSFIDKNAKRSIGISSDDSIVMMIAVGIAPDEYKVCESQRRDTSSFIEYL